MRACASHPRVTMMETRSSGSAEGWTWRRTIFSRGMGGTFTKYAATASTRKLLRCFIIDGRIFQPAGARNVIGDSGTVRVPLGQRCFQTLPVSDGVLVSLCLKSTHARHAEAEHV